MISLRRAFSIASATAGSTISTPTTSRARAASESADRADAAVEVEDALVAAQRRRTRRRRRRARSAISVLVWKNASGEIRKSQVAELLGAAAGAPASSVVSPPWVLSPSPAVCVQNRPSAVDRVDQRVDVELAGRGDEPHLQLAGAAALADDEVAQEARAASRRSQAPRPWRAAARRAPARARRCRARRRACSRRSGRSRPSGRARGSRTRARRPSPVPNEYSSLLR